MKKLQRLQEKKSKLVVGLMSGTSVDGIDAALVRISGNGTRTRIEQMAFDTYDYPKEFRNLVLANSLPATGSVDLLTRLNVLVAHFFADAVKKIARKGSVRLSQIDLIGSHGQTVHHLPKPERHFGKTIRSTLQIGDPSTIAKLTGIPTVGDFRSADMALDGEGAPLVPYFDFLMFRSKTKNRILLNLGGIANFTMLPRNCTTNDVIAFDTGPSNMIVDGLMMKFYHKRYDEGGKVGLKGRVLPGLLAWMMNQPYLAQRPPKSTGRELYGEMYQKEFLKRGQGERKQDLIATAAAFTAESIYDQYVRFVRRHMRVDEMLASGGGTYNQAIMRRLQRSFAPATVRTIEDIGFSSDAKEAICFAVLANETISENPSNIPSVTGAVRPTILGKICL